MILVRKKSGFSILEIMVSVLMLASLGLGLYRLQLVSLITSQQIITKQLMAQMASNLANQIYSHLNYTNTNNINRNGFYYAENAYSDHTTLNGLTDCSNTLDPCDDIKYAAYALYQWKQSLKDTSIPKENLHAIVCLDNSMAIPTLVSPNCNGAPNLVIKIVWHPHYIDSESSLLFADNYIMINVAAR